MVKKSLKNIKIVFFGTPDFALEPLKQLIDYGYLIIACVTNPDKAKGRHLSVSFSPVKKLALKNNIKIFQPENLKDDEFYSQLKKLSPDIIIVVAYGKILPKKIINLPKYGSINIHASLLPKYRGPSPLQYTLLKGDKKTGVTIMKMDEHMDTGPIISQKEIPISDNDTLVDLHDKLKKIGAELLLKTLPLYLEEKIRLKRQDNNQASYTKIIKKKDGRINWQTNAQEVERKIRSFNPWPGTYTHAHKTVLKIIEARYVKKEKPGAAGTLFFEDKKIFVSCQNDLLEILKIQVPGHKVLTSEEFISGYPEFNNAELK